MMLKKPLTIQQIPTISRIELCFLVRTDNGDVDVVIDGGGAAAVVAFPFTKAGGIVDPECGTACVGMPDPNYQCELGRLCFGLAMLFYETINSRK